MGAFSVTLGVKEKGLFSRVTSDSLQGVLCDFFLFTSTKRGLTWGLPWQPSG